jgi:hypothetical protein
MITDVEVRPRVEHLTDARQYVSGSFRFIFDGHNPVISKWNRPPANRSMAAL